MNWRDTFQMNFSQRACLGVRGLVTAFRRRLVAVNDLRHPLSFVTSKVLSLNRDLFVAPLNAKILTARP